MRRLVVDALAATGEWPVRVRIISNHQAGESSMKRWFVEYETCPHGETLDEPDLFD